MRDNNSTPATGAGELAVHRDIGSAPAKWAPLTVSDDADITSMDELIATIKRWCSLPHDRAKQDAGGRFGCKPADLR